MNENLQLVVEGAISSATGRPAAIVKTTATGGGCISETNVVTMQDGQRYFVKSNRTASTLMFPAEALGLRTLRETKTIRIPEVVTLGPPESSAGLKLAGTSFLILEYIEPGHQRGDFSECLGRQLAELHRAGSSDQFGFPQDNFIGATPQPNAPNANWIEFWVEQRIGYQLNLAYRNGFGDELSQAGKRFLDRVPQLLESTAEPPALIHGDLWSGNYLAAADGSPVLIDPAVYYAQRESEFGMTTLFGGFDRKFYDAYCECWPLAEGWEERVETYRLYHLLNHLNLFGRSYLSGCLEIMDKYT
jgi:protein-ribulosamine 3-kinase